MDSLNIQLFYVPAFALIMVIGFYFYYLKKVEDKALFKSFFWAIALFAILFNLIWEVSQGFFLDSKIDFLPPTSTCDGWRFICWEYFFGRRELGVCRFHALAANCECWISSSFPVYDVTYNNSLGSFWNTKEEGKISIFCYQLRSSVMKLNK